MTLQLVLWLAHTPVIRQIWVWDMASVLFICSRKIRFVWHSIISFRVLFHSLLLSPVSSNNAIPPVINSNLHFKILSWSLCWLIDVYSSCFKFHCLYLVKHSLHEWVSVSYLSGSLSLSQSRYAEQNHWILIVLFLAVKIGFWFAYPSFSVGYFSVDSWLKGPGLEMMILELVGYDCISAC